MCYYITATIPFNNEMEKVKDILNEHNMNFFQINNKLIKSYLPSNILYFRPTKTYCDCDTALGVFNRQWEYEELLQSQKVRSLRKKKWTQKQIDTWIKEKISSSKPKIKKSITPMERENDILNWFSLIQEVLDLESIYQIGILKHWYQSSLENEEIKIKRKERVNLTKIKKDFLFNIENDVLYEFFIK